jgi:DNA-directed RNA polymerase subunit omega
MTKKTIIALREIAEDKVSIPDLEKSAVLRLRKEPDENLEQEDVEEEENDDFENLYKGQISKSGIAILPSKRTRKIPEVKKEIPVAAAEESTEAPVQEEAASVDEPLELKEEVTE